MCGFWFGLFFSFVESLYSTFRLTGTRGESRPRLSPIVDRSPANALINKGVKRRKARWWKMWEEGNKETRYREIKSREMMKDCS